MWMSVLMGHMIVMQMQCVLTVLDPTDVVRSLRITYLAQIKLKVCKQHKLGCHSLIHKNKKVPSFAWTKFIL